MSRAEVLFLVVVALFVLTAYLPRILLWWVRRRVRRHMEAMGETQAQSARRGTEPAAPDKPKKATIADDEGEYVPFEEVGEE